MTITLKAARTNAGLKQMDVCKAIGISQGALSRWEHGVSEPGINQAKALCKLYKVSIDEVIFLPSRTK